MQLYYCFCIVPMILIKDVSGALKITLFVSFLIRGITLQKKSPICTKEPLPFYGKSIPNDNSYNLWNSVSAFIIDKCQSDVCTLTFYNYNFVSIFH